MSLPEMIPETRARLEEVRSHPPRRVSPDALVRIVSDDRLQPMSVALLVDDREFFATFPVEGDDLAAVVKLYDAELATRDQRDVATAKGRTRSHAGVYTKPGETALRLKDLVARWYPTARVDTSANSARAAMRARQRDVTARQKSLVET